MSNVSTVTNTNSEKTNIKQYSEITENDLAIKKNQERIAEDKNMYISLSLYPLFRSFASNHDWY